MKLSNILPSMWLRRIIVITLTLILVAIVVYSILKDKQEAEIQEETTLAVSFVDENNTERREELDSDGDGLPDWEEQLWGLDPENPDTDGDGVSDDQYVESKKNIQERRVLGLENIETTLTESEKLGRSLYTALLAIEQEDGVVDVETQDLVSQNIVDYVSTLPVSGTLYLRENLNLVENTKENTYVYRDRIEQLLEDYPLDTDDIELIVQGIESRDAYETRIARVSDKYDSLLNELADMEVPYVIAGRHTELLNGIAHFTGAFKNLNQDEADDLVSLSVVVQMERVLAQVADTAENLQKFFEIIEDESVFNS